MEAIILICGLFGLAVLAVILYMMSKVAVGVAHIVNYIERTDQEIAEEVKVIISEAQFEEPVNRTKH